MKVKLIIVLAGLISVLSSCDQANTAGTGAHSGEPLGQSLDILPIYNAQKISCQQRLMINHKTWQINTLRFFISDIQGQTLNNKWQQLPLATTPFQTLSTALIGSDCQFSASSHANNDEQDNWQLRFDSRVDLAKFKALSFKLGVGFADNHANPLLQPAPLNDSSMFWVWRTGHKFMRIEMMEQAADSDNVEPQHWVYHLGSVGCSSPSTMRSPTSACRFPNLATITLPLANKAQPPILAFNLSALLSGITPNAVENCQSEPDNIHCQQLWQNITNTETKGTGLFYWADNS